MQTDINSNEKDAKGKFCGHAILGDELKRRMRFLAAALPMRMVRTGTRCQTFACSTAEVRSGRERRPRRVTSVAPCRMRLGCSAISSRAALHR